MSRSLKKSMDESSCLSRVRLRRDRGLHGSPRLHAFLSHIHGDTWLIKACLVLCWRDHPH